MGYCRKCKERRVGLAQSHCTGCHRTFKSANAFDQHRRNFQCLDPLEIGMRADERGVWSKPMPESYRLRFMQGQNSRL